MELDDLKAIWQKTNEQLELNNRLTRQLITDTLRNRQRKSLGKFFGFYYFDLLANSICFILFVVLLYFYATDWKFILSGILAIVIQITIAFFEIKSIIILKKIDPIKNSILECASQFVKFKHTNKTFQIYMFLIFPIAIIAVAPIVLKGFRGIDLFRPEIFSRFAVNLVLGCLVGYLILFILYMFYFRKAILDMEETLEDYKSLSD